MIHLLLKEAPSRPRRNDGDGSGYGNGNGYRNGQLSWGSGAGAASYGFVYENRWVGGHLRGCGRAAGFGFTGGKGSSIPPLEEEE